MTISVYILYFRKVFESYLTNDNTIITITLLIPIVCLEKKKNTYYSKRVKRHHLRA